MKLLIKQRVFSWTDSYDVYDEQENPKYFVKAEFFTLGHQIHVYDRNEQEVGAVREQWPALLPVFDVDAKGEALGRIQKKFSFFVPKYDLDYRGWRVEGDFLGWDYDVLEGCSRVAHISKQLLSWGDTYVIEFSNPADELMCLLLVIAIDAANCGK